MFIVIDGKVDFCLEMKKNVLTPEEVEVVSKDLGDKELANRLHAYKHAHKLCA